MDYFNEFIISHIGFICILPVIVVLNSILASGKY